VRRKRRKKTTYTNAVILVLLGASGMLEEIVGEIHKITGLVGIREAFAETIDEDARIR
jgi:hypothetical protein